MFALRTPALRIVSVNAAASLIESVAAREEGTTIGMILHAAGVVDSRLRSGVIADLAVLPRERFDALEREGIVQSGSVREIGKTHAAIACRRQCVLEAPIDGGKLIDLLLEAPAIVVPDLLESTVGRHMRSVFEVLGIAKQISDKLTVCVDGAAAMHDLASSNAAGAIGFTQSTEIVSNTGVRMLGFLPNGYGLETAYCAAVVTSGNSRDVAQSFIAALCSPETSDLRLRAGFT